MKLFSKKKEFWVEIIFLIVFVAVMVSLAIWLRAGRAVKQSGTMPVPAGMSATGKAGA
jgi:hypothetical protein